MIAASGPQPDRVECDHLGGARRGRSLALQRPHTAPAVTPTLVLTSAVASAVAALTAALAAAIAVGKHGGKAEQGRR